MIVYYIYTQGWEEVVDVAVTQLLKTVLSKGVKDHSVNLPELELPLDCKKIKRHIALMCDRIIKGGRLVATGTQSLTNGPHQPLSPLVEQPES
jgi:Bardet-Biedl syndrome 9 protein